MVVRRPRPRLADAVLTRPLLLVPARSLFGIAHVPRLEDWPIVAMERVSFKLSPAGFFDCSPAIDVPPQEAIQGGGSSECGGGGGECGAAAGGAGSAKACCKEEGHACSRSRL